MIGIINAIPLHFAASMHNFHDGDEIFSTHHIFHQCGELLRHHSKLLKGRPDVVLLVLPPDGLALAVDHGVRGHDAVGGGVSLHNLHRDDLDATL